MQVQQLGRLWRTVRPLRPTQVWQRVRLGVRRRLWVRRAAAVDARYRERAAAGAVRWDVPGLAAAARLRAARRVPEQALAAAEGALAGRFHLLGETRELGRPVPWDRPDLMQALLWKTHLHEAGWALDLALAARASGDARFRAGFFALVEEWTAAEPIARPGFHRVAWNERVVATRLVHWAMAGALLGLRAGDPAADRLGREIVRHALFLRDNLALDLQANHLFRDCVALAFADAIAGCTTGGLALLEHEVREQILPDGAHYEGSAMYHAVCLADLVELQCLLGAGAPGWLGDAVRRAGGFLESVLLGDGDIPLLGDAWRGEIAPSLLLAQARETAGPLVTPGEPERWSGLVRLERGPVRAVVRVGPHGPDHQLGHAHADLLSFELSHGARRIVVDTGTGAYADGPARRRLRSTAAHNTVQLDGAELLEAWSSFRSGRRGRARCDARGEAGRWAWIAGSHDGYAWLPGRPRPHRLLLVAADLAVVLDAVLGEGRHRVTSRLHLHPDAEAAGARVHTLAGAIERSAVPYHERFGETREMPELAVADELALPWLGGFLVRFDGEPAAPSASLAWADDAVRLVVREGERGLALRWRPAAASVELDVLGSRA
jgi:uncharacterized heparinase superfamily protein